MDAGEHRLDGHTLLDHEPERRARGGVEQRGERGLGAHPAAQPVGARLDAQRLRVGRGGLDERTDRRRHVRVVQCPGDLAGGGAVGDAHDGDAVAGAGEVRGGRTARDVADQLADAHDAKPQQRGDDDEDRDQFRQRPPAAAPRRRRVVVPGAAPAVVGGRPATPPRPPVRVVVVVGVGVGVVGLPGVVGRIVVVAASARAKGTLTLVPLVRLLGVGHPVGVDTLAAVAALVAVAGFVRIGGSVPVSCLLRVGTTPGGPPITDTSIAVGAATTITWAAVPHAALADPALADPWLGGSAAPEGRVVVAAGGRIGIRTAGPAAPGGVGAVRPATASGARGLTAVGVLVEDLIEIAAGHLASCEPAIPPSGVQPGEPPDPRRLSRSCWRICTAAS